MGLFDIFTGGAYKDASAGIQANAQYVLQQQQAAANAAREQGLAALRSGQTGALGAIAPAIETGRGDISGGQEAALGALYGSQGLASAALGGAVDPALAAIYGGAGAAAGAYDPLAHAASIYGQLGTGAGTALSNALGLGGAGGNAAAQAAFQASPGYQFQLDEAIKAGTRGANAAGMGALGGNVLDALTRVGSGLASQEFYNKYLPSIQNLAGLYSPLEANALNAVAGGRAAPFMQAGLAEAGIYTGTGSKLSDLFSGTGARAASTISGGAQSLADLAKTGGLASADVFSNEAAREAALQQAIAQAQMSSYGNYGNTANNALLTGAVGATGASKNIWDTLGGGLNFAAGQGWFGLKPT